MTLSPTDTGLGLSLVPGRPDPRSGAGPGTGPDARPGTGPDAGPSARTPVSRTLAAGDLHVDVLTGLDEVAGIAPAWSRLYAAGDLGNADLHPAWVLAWYRTFVRDDDVVVAAVRAGEELVGVAPLWRMRLAPRLSVLQLAGAGRHVLLTDTPGILSPTGHHRKVVKAAADAVAELPGWAWCTLTLSPAQGWSDQLADPASACVFPRVGRTCVITDLPAEADAFEAGLKRNVRESIRRSVNRLTRDTSGWAVERVTGDPRQLVPALAEVVALHRQRARLDDHKSHRDVFADARYARLLAAVATAPGGADLLSVYTLRVDGRALAAQVVLDAPTTRTLLVSGIHPDGWRYSPMALLTREIARDAVAAGRTRLNHSAGPDTGKLRWSEAMETHAEFSIVRSSLLARSAFVAHSQLAVGAALRRERRRRQGAAAPAAAPTA